MIKPNKDTIIYIARHGETDFNAKGIIQGQTVDRPLNKQGQLQATQLGHLLKHINFDHVFSSDLLRAKQTAELAVLDKQLVVNTRELLRERKWGEYEGKPSQLFRDENKKILEYIESLSDREQFEYDIGKGIETLKSVAQRLTVFLREIAVTYPGKTILIVSHAGIMRALLIALGFATPNELKYKAISNAGFIKLKSDGVEFFIDEVMGINKSL